MIIRGDCLLKTSVCLLYCVIFIFFAANVIGLQCEYVDKLNSEIDSCYNMPEIFHYMMDVTNSSVALGGFNTSFRYGICCNAEQSVQRFDASSNETLVRISANNSALACHDNPLTGENCTYEYDVEIPSADCYPELFDDCAAGYDCVLKLSQLNISGEASLIGNCSATYPWSMCCRSAFEEDCTNNVDDDFDGLIDCADDECNAVGSFVPANWMCDGSNEGGMSIDGNDYYCSYGEYPIFGEQGHCCETGAFWNGLACIDYTPCYSDPCPFDPVAEFFSWLGHPDCVNPVVGQACCLIDAYGDDSYIYDAIEVY